LIPGIVVKNVPVGLLLDSVAVMGFPGVINGIGISVSPVAYEKV